MASFAETVRFCFPAPLTSSSSPRESSMSPRPGRQIEFEDQDLADENMPVTLGNVVRTYALDWILAIGLWLVLALLNRSEGHKREFSLNDLSIQHSFAVNERVPPNLLALFSAGVPLAVIVPISVFIARNGWDIHNSLLGWFMSYTMAGVVTQVVKMSVGRPRPDLIARCMPAPGSVDHAVYGLSTVDICTNPNTLLLADGFKSFPSGHSSLSFAGLGFLSLYLAGKMHLWDKRGHRTRAWFALSPLLGGAMVAISRTEDNRHHWQDVLVGSLLGLFVAWVSYRTYFPPIHHRQCHLPLAPRDITPAFGNGDEESGRDQVRLMEDGDAAPRPSAEQEAWRGTR